MESPGGNAAFTQWTNQDLELEKATFSISILVETYVTIFLFPPGILILHLNFRQWKSLSILKSFQSLANWVAPGPFAPAL